MPITFGLLAKLFNYLQNVIFNSVIGLGLQTACLVAFRGFFRCGEFTCWTSFDNNIHLCIGDINFVSHDCVKLFLKTSKTVVIQWVYIKLLKTDSDLCPYKLLMKFIINRKSCNTTQKNSLFVQEHNTALSRNYFISKLKALISCLCFVHCDYSGHAYGQQQLVLATVSTNIWCKCFVRYIRTSDHDIHSAQKLVCHWLNRWFRNALYTFVYILTRQICYSFCLGICNMLSVTYFVYYYYLQIIHFNSTFNTHSCIYKVGSSVSCMTSGHMIYH